MNTKVLTIFIDEFKSNRPCFTFKASKPIFITFLVYIGNSLFDYLLFNCFVCYGRKQGNHFAHNFIHKFGFAYSEELEVNQWITLDILSSQSECAKNTIHCFSTKSISWTIAGEVKSWETGDIWRWLQQQGETER